MSVAVPVSTATAEPRETVGRSRRRFAIGRAGIYVLLCAASVIAAAPFLWMILASFKSGREIRSIPPTFWPREATLDNYRAILDEPDLPLLRFYRNSAFVALANVATTLFTSSLLGYLLAKFEFRFNKPLFWDTCCCRGCTCSTACGVWCSRRRSAPSACSSCANSACRSRTA
jgi:multiple sugar transport system permease protein